MATAISHPDISHTGQIFFFCHIFCLFLQLFIQKNLSNTAKFLSVNIPTHLSSYPGN